jgi:hypothetical protein
MYLRVRQALRAAFQHLATVGQMNGSTALKFGLGDFAKVIDGFRPDTAYFVSTLPSTTGPNRAPGDIKLSWKWSTAMASHRIPGYYTEYCQVLS